MKPNSAKDVKDDKKYNLFANSTATAPEYDFKKCERSACFLEEFSL